MIRDKPQKQHQSHQTCHKQVQHTSQFIRFHKESKHYCDIIFIMWRNWFWKSSCLDTEIYDIFIKHLIHIQLINVLNKTYLNQTDTENYFSIKENLAKACYDADVVSRGHDPWPLWGSFGVSGRVRDGDEGLQRTIAGFEQITELRRDVRWVSAGSRCLLTRLCLITPV